MVGTIRSSFMAFDALKIPEKEMINFYIKQEKCIRYGNDFFEEVLLGLCASEEIEKRILPISFRTMREAAYNAVVCGENKYHAGHEYHFRGKQSMLVIYLDTESSRLTPSLKATLRHEILHYVLDLLDVSYGDQGLMFWCCCYVFDGGAYAPLPEKSKNIYDVFVSLYDQKVKTIDTKGSKSKVLRNLLIDAQELNDSTISNDFYEILDKYIDESISLFLPKNTHSSFT